MKEHDTEPGGQLRFQPGFEQCRRQAFSTVTASLAELLSQADGALLDFADRAQNNDVQQRLFAARGLILGQRPLIQSRFQQCFSQAFLDLGKPHPQRSSATTADNHAELGLRLLDLVEMDENIATETLVANAKDRCYTEVHALRQRLSVVAGGHQLGEDEVPAGPYHLVNCFRSALRDLDIDVKVRVILYALFDKHVLQSIGSLYSEINETLKQAGVLPNLKHVMNPRKHVGNPPPLVSADGNDGRLREQPIQSEPGGARGAWSDIESGAGPGAEAGPEHGAAAHRSVSDELLGAILQLMSGRRARVQAAAAITGVPASERFGAAVNRVRRETLISTLDNVQSRGQARYATAFTDPVAAARLESDPQFIETVKTELRVERNAFFDQVEAQQMEPVDVDAIDIVGLLFEYMLNDAQLPNLAKALLSRLHTPYLKVALLDRQLLYNDDHGARQLLDLMVEAGENYVRESAPAWGIFPALRSIVERILAEFTDRLSLFDELLVLLRAKVKEQRRKTTTSEERARQAAMGRDKFHAAKQRATAEIDRRIDQPSVIPEVAAFLSRVWLHELVFVLLRSPSGEESKEWLRALQIADQLVSLGTTFAAEVRTSQLEHSLSQLLQAIEAGLDSLGGNRPVEWLALAPLLTDAVRLRQRANDVSASERSQPHDTIALRPVVEGAVLETKTTGHNGVRPTAPTIAADEARMIARLRELEFGTWFEFKPADGRAPRRLKMSWFSTVTGTCMFVDRSGMQTETRTMLSLAQDLLGQRARIAEHEKTAPFVERALGAILNMLRSSASAAPVPTLGQHGQRS